MAKKYEEKNGKQYQYMENKAGERVYLSHMGDSKQPSWVHQRDLTESNEPFRGAPTRADPKTQPGRRANISFPGRLRKYKEDVQEATKGLQDRVYEEQRIATDEMNPLTATALHAGIEARKLGVGAADMADALGASYMPSNRNFAKDIEERAVREKEHDATMGAFEEGTSVTKAGKMIPYLMTGRYLEPAARKTVGKAIVGAGQQTSRAAKAAGGRGRQTLAAQAQKPGVTGKVATQAEEIIAPLERKLANMAKQPKMRNEFRDDILPQVGTAAAIGGMEGAAHYDQNVEQGMLGSTIGHISGRFLGPAFSKAPNKNSQNTNELLDWAEDQGFRTLPGLRLGQPKYQMYESKLRGNEKSAGLMRDLDDANDEVVSRVAAEAIGMNPAKMRDITPDELSFHMNSLKKEFDSLEDVTTGKITKEMISEIGDNVKALNSAKVNKVFADFAGIKQTRGRKKGRFTPATFSGKDYKKLSARIKLAKDSATIKGDLDDAKIYDSMLKSLDDGMEEGIKKHGGEASAAQWKNLRERYALTNTLMDNGLTPTGGIDLNKLGNYFMQSDTKRMMQGTDQRISDLHKLAKVNYIQKQQPSGGLNKYDVDEEGWISHMKGEGKEGKMHMFSTPMSLLTPMPRKMKFDLYKSGYPAQTGLLGMDSANRTWNMPDQMRALEQGAKPHQSVVEGAEDIYNDPRVQDIRSLGTTAKDKVFGAAEDIMTPFKSDLSEEEAMEQYMLQLQQEQQRQRGLL